MFSIGHLQITKKETLDEGWWEARNANGQMGLIPTNFLDLKNPIVKTEPTDFAKKRDLIGGSVAVRPKQEKTTQFRKDIVSMPPTAFDDKPVGKPKQVSIIYLRSLKLLLIMLPEILCFNENPDSLNLVSELDKPFAVYCALSNDDLLFALAV